MVGDQGVRSAAEYHLLLQGAGQDSCGHWTLELHQDHEDRRYEHTNTLEAALASRETGST